MFEGPVEVSIAAADDTLLSNPSNSQVLTYDGATHKWKNAAAVSGTSNFTEQGTWNATTTYAAGSVVSYVGSRYLAPTGAPASSFFDTSKWVLLGSMPDTF